MRQLFPGLWKEEENIRKLLQLYQAEVSRRFTPGGRRRNENLRRQPNLSFEILKETPTALRRESFIYRKEVS